MLEKFLTDKELKEFMRIIHKYYPENKRNCLALWTLLETGARSEELLAIRRCDIRVKRCIFICGSKRGNDRLVKIGADLFTKLKMFATDFKDDERLFPISYDMLRKVWVWYRPVKKPIHCLRHTFAVGKYKKNNDFVKVSRSMGHKTLEGTDWYLKGHHKEYTPEEMRAAMDIDEFDFTEK